MRNHKNDNSMYLDTMKTIIKIQGYFKIKIWMIDFL